MAHPKIHIGLEIGTKKLKMVIGEIRSDQSVHIIGSQSVDTVGVTKGEITNQSQLRTCLRQLIKQAEEQSDCRITHVFVAVSGGHIIGQNLEVSIPLLENDQTVTKKHIELLKEKAHSSDIPGKNEYLHLTPKHYSLDNLPYTSPPIGASGNQLSASYHIVYGSRPNLLQTIQFITSQSLQVQSMTFSPIVAAQYSLSSEDRANGAILIDIGAGTTDYVVYHEGEIIASGCIPVAGDHISNDIHLIAKKLKIDLPLSKAEDLKIREGEAGLDPARSVGTILIKDEKGFAEIRFERTHLNGSIRDRLEQIFEKVENRLTSEIPKDKESILTNEETRVYLIGGTSNLRGINEIAENILKIPVAPTQNQLTKNRQAIFSDPSYATVIGLIRFAQILEEETADLKPGFFKRAFRKLFPHQS